MKNLLLLFAACLMVTGCEKDVIGEGYPEMEGFYTESCGLPEVTIDSVKLFSVKVDNYTDVYPYQRNTPYIPRSKQTSSLHRCV